MGMSLTGYAVLTLLSNAILTFCGNAFITPTTLHRLDAENLDVALRAKTTLRCRPTSQGVRGLSNGDTNTFEHVICLNRLHITTGTALVAHIYKLLKNRCSLLF